MSFAATIKRARQRNYHGEAALDLEDPLERVAVLAHRLSFETPDGATSMATSPDGQVGLARTWHALTPADRQLYRRRAAALLDFAENGRDLRSRPEDNVA